MIPSETEFVIIHRNDQHSTDERISKDAAERSGDCSLLDLPIALLGEQGVFSREELEDNIRALIPSPSGDNHYGLS